MIERCLGHRAAARAWARRALALNPHFSLLLGGDGAEARAMRRLSLLVSLAASLARAGGRRRAPARQLHDQPLQPRRGRRRPDLRPLRGRHGRDPDLPGRPRSTARPRGRLAAVAHLTRRRPARPRSSRSRHASPSRRARRACTRRGSRRSSRGPRIAGGAASRYATANYAGRIGWKEIVVGARAPSSQRRAARLPEGPAPEPARRHARPPRRSRRPDDAAADAARAAKALAAPDRVGDGGFAA